MDSLPHRQAALLQFLQARIREQGIPPSIPEICEHFGYRSPRAAAELIEKLEARGAIAREPGSRRGIRLLSPDPVLRQRNALPLVGRIAAGAPVLAGDDQVEDWIAVPPELFHPRANLLFRVRGQSMIGAGIHDGDLVGVHLTDEVAQKQIVAAVVPHPVTGDREMTLKRYRRQRSKVTLLSENPDQEAYPPLVYDVEQQPVEIVGLYTGLIRLQAGVA